MISENDNFATAVANVVTVIFVTAVAVVIYNFQINIFQVVRNVRFLEISMISNFIVIPNVFI